MQALSAAVAIALIFPLKGSLASGTYRIGGKAASVLQSAHVRDGHRQTKAQLLPYGRLCEQVVGRKLKSGTYFFQNQYTGRRAFSGDRSVMAGTDAAAQRGALIAESVRLAKTENSGRQCVRKHILNSPFIKKSDCRRRRSRATAERSMRASDVCIAKGTSRVYP